MLKDEIKEILISTLTPEQDHIEFIGHIADMIVDCTVKYYMEFIAQVVAGLLKGDENDKD